MSFARSKGPLSSLTIIASLIAMLVSVLSSVGIHIAADVLPMFNEVLTGIASAVAIYGRIRAKTFIE